MNRIPVTVRPVFHPPDRSEMSVIKNLCIKTGPARVMPAAPQKKQKNEMVQGNRTIAQFSCSLFFWGTGFS